MPDTVTSPNWRYDYLFSISRGSWLIHLGVVVLTTLMLDRGQFTLAFLAWCGLMVAVSSLQLALGSHYQRTSAHALPVVVANRYVHAHMVLTGCTGIMWGMGAVLLPFQSMEPLLLYSLAMGGTALGAVSALHAVRLSCSLAIWLSLPLLAIAHLSYSIDLRGVAIAGMIILYAIVLTMLGHRMGSFLTQNVALSTSLAEKVHSLTETTHELERTRRLAEETSASKTRLLAHASHDLRQPVHAIGLFAECLSDTVNGDDARKMLVSIEQSVAYLNTLFRSLLDMAALENGRVQPNISNCSADEIIGAAVRQFRDAAQSRDIDLRYIPTRLYVQTDPGLFFIMVQNLLSNALKYAPGARVLVGCRRSGSNLVVEVHDTGPGISRANQSRVFDEFVQLDCVRKVRQEGLGLGLSIVQRLASLVGVTVEMASEPGRGTLIRIKGLEIAPAPSRRTGEPPVVTSSLEGARILIVDDDHATRNAMQKLIERWGCEVIVKAEPPNIALVKTADFLIVDQELNASQDGLTFAKQATENNRMSAAIITGALTRDLQDAAHAAGIPVLEKPARPAQVRSLLRTALSTQTSPVSAATAAAADLDETPRTRNSADT